MALYKNLVKKVSISPEMKTKQKNYLEKGVLPIIDQGQDIIGGYTDNSNLQLPCSLPVIIFGDHTRAVKYIDFPFGAGADGIKVLQPKENVFPKYLYYATQYLVLRLEDRGYARHYQYVEKKELDVPDIDEQKRVVARIEELFSELDNGVETLKKTEQQLAVYRQAILIHAFNNIEDMVDMEKIAVMTDPQPSHRTPPEVIGGVPYIGVGDINYSTQTIDTNEARKVSVQVLQEHIKRYTLHEGDFIMGKIGTIGKPFRLPLPQNYALSANVILIQPISKFIIPDFLFWQFSSPLITSQLTLGAKATSQPAFGITKARKLKIKICSLEKQKEILESIYEKITICDSIEKTVDIALQQAEAMRQSILKRAFEGGL